MQRTKVLITLLVVFISIPTIELIREEIVYLSESRKLKSVCQQIEAGITKEQVELLAGRPDFTTAEAWHWDAMLYQGALWKRLGLTTVKGHYGLDVTFSKDGKVTEKLCGIN